MMMRAYFISITGGNSLQRGSTQGSKLDSIIKADSWFRMFQRIVITACYWDKAYRSVKFNKVGASMLTLKSQRTTLACYWNKLTFRHSLSLQSWMGIRSYTGMRIPKSLIPSYFFSWRWLYSIIDMMRDMISSLLTYHFWEVLDYANSTILHLTVKLATPRISRLSDLDDATVIGFVCLHTIAFVFGELAQKNTILCTDVDAKVM